MDEQKYLLALSSETSRHDLCNCKGPQLSAKGTVPKMVSLNVTSEDRKWEGKERDVVFKEEE